VRLSFSVPLKPLSGKQNFAIRLANELKKHGFKITNRKPDINLVFTKGIKKGCKNILRVDGIWMNTDINYRKKNKKIKNIMQKCDGTIYQNKFCKKASDRFIGHSNLNTIILNGADRATDIKPLRHDKPYLLSAARWRPHKRLNDTVKCFLHSGLSKEYDLIIMGDNSGCSIKDQSIIYMGRQKNSTVLSAIVGCHFAVHLAWIDWCPNFVVEAIVNGKNVLHTNSGGTKYVVQENGICLKDTKWNFKPIRLYKPPPLDMNIVGNAYRTMLKLPFQKYNHLLIDNIASQYIDFFNLVVKK